MKLFILINLFSCTLFAQTSEWEKVGVAQIQKPKMEIILGTTYNKIMFEEYGTIPFKHQYLDSLEVQEIKPGYFKVTSNKLNGFSIKIKNLESKNTVVKCDFILMVKGLSFPQNSVKIDFEDEFYPNDEKEMINKHFLPVIHDFLANFLTKFISNSCTEKAVKACGTGKIKFVDIHAFGRGCSFVCE